MEDYEILQMYNARDESAIRESRRKFGPLLRSLALRLLRSNEDAEETESDTYMKVWNAVPPAQPLSAAGPRWIGCAPVHGQSAARVPMRKACVSWRSPFLAATTDDPLPTQLPCETP